MDKDFIYLLDDNDLYKYNVDTKKTEYFSIFNKPNSFSFSKSKKYFAINYNSYVSIYDYNGNLITKLPSSLNLYKSVFINDKFILLLSSNGEKSVFEVYNIKTGQKLYNKSFEGENFINSVSILDSNDIIAVNNDKDVLQIILPKLSIEKLFKIDFIPDNIEVSKDKKYLVATKKNGFIVYTLDNNKKVIIDDNNQKIEQNRVEKITQVTKKISKDETFKNVNINMLVNVSKTEGYAPLSTIISINIDKPKNVIAYYLDLAGKVKVGKGIPPKTIKLTLKKSGKYNVLIAVKDINNNVYKKIITIEVKEKKEKTFKDFLKEMGQ